MFSEGVFDWCEDPKGTNDVTMSRSCLYHVCPRGIGQKIEQLGFGKWEEIIEAYSLSIACSFEMKSFLYKDRHRITCNKVKIATCFDDGISDVILLYHQTWMG